jgi:hypothetical protein
VTAAERSGPPVVLRAASCRARLSGRRPGTRTAAHWAVPFSLRNGGPGKLRSTRRCRSRTRQGSGRRRCCWRTRRWPYTTSPRHRTLRRDMPRTGSGPARPTRQCRSRIRSRSDPGCCCSSCPRPHKSWRRRKTRRRGRAPSRPRNASRPPPRGRRRTSRARIAPPWIDTSVAAPTEAERVRLETEAERVKVASALRRKRAPGLAPCSTIRLGAAGSWSVSLCRSGAPTQVENFRPERARSLLPRSRCRSDRGFRCARR